MSTTKGDLHVTTEDRTEPDGSPDALARATTEALGTLATVASPRQAKVDTSPGFDPWRFGTHDVSAELRQEILEKGFPDTPDDQLFTHRREAAKAVAGDKPATAETNAERRADTLRVDRKPPLVSPWRAAAPWLFLSALGVSLLLWLLLGQSPPRPAPTEVEMSSLVGASAPKTAPQELPNPPSPHLVAPPSAHSAPPEVATAPEKSTASKPTKSPAGPLRSAVAARPPRPVAEPPATPTSPAPTPSSSRIVPADD